MHKYRLVAKKGEGTFSEVLKAQCIKNGKYVAIKCMKNHFDSLDQVNNLREIQALRRLSPHANIIKLLEVLYDQPTGRLALVFELMDMNIYELIRGRRHYVAEDRVKNYMYQLMKAMDHMHRNGIFHRDIKPENILIMDDCLKLADFGSCRGIYSKQPYTEYISTRWYRAPECLLTDGYYNYKMDMWGVGCVFFEIVSLFPLFPGTNELDQIQKIHNILGTPPPDLLAKMKKRSQHMDFNFPAKEGGGVAKLIPHVNPDCVDLIVKLLSYNPDERLSARQALRHPYFKELRDTEKRQKALMAPDLSTHFTSLAEVEKMRNQHVSSNGSDHGEPSSPPESSPPDNASLPSISHRTQPQDGHKEEDDAHMRLPAQNSLASMSEGPDGEASLPPIANLSLGKANMTGNAAHAARRSTMSYYEGFKGKTGSNVSLGAASAAGPVASAAGSGAAAGSGVQSQAPNAAALAARRQSVGAVPKLHSNKSQQLVAGVQVHGQAASHTSSHGTGGGSIHSAATTTASMAVSGGHPARHEAQSGKYNKANLTKANSKYVSPYSLRQLAGQASDK